MKVIRRVPLIKCSSQQRAQLSPDCPVLSKVVSIGTAARKGFKSPGLELGLAIMEIVHVANSGIHAGTRRKVEKVGLASNWFSLSSDIAFFGQHNCSCEERLKLNKATECKYAKPQRPNSPA